MNWHGSGYLRNIGKLTYNGSRKEQEKGVHMSTTQPIRSTVQLNQFKKYYLEIFPEQWQSRKRTLCYRASAEFYICHPDSSVYFYS